MSFDLKNRIRRGTEVEVSIPFDQGNVFRPKDLFGEDYKRSQSLSIRAMSFDTLIQVISDSTCVSIPFDQGNVFRHIFKKEFVKEHFVSIPFDQGNVFRHIERD